MNLICTVIPLKLSSLEINFTVYVRLVFILKCIVYLSAKGGSGCRLLRNLGDFLIDLVLKEKFIFKKSSYKSTKLSVWQKSDIFFWFQIKIITKLIELQNKIIKKKHMVNKLYSKVREVQNFR